MYDWAEFRHFRYLLAILEKGGFRIAADELHTSQPNLTVQARQFQDNASIRLFRKSKSGRIYPTRTGQAFLALAPLLLEVRDEIIDTLIAIERGEINSVRLGSTPLVDLALFHAFCGLHKELMPKCAIRPTHGDTAQLAEEIVDGMVDAAIVTLPLKHPSLHIEEIRRDRLVVCLRRDHPLASKAALEATDLQNNLAIFYHPQRHPDAHQRLLEFLAGVGVAVEEYSRASHPSEMQTLVKEGYAVTSHSSQGLTAGRVLANVDTESSRMLINTRLAYVAVSRASEDARIYTNDAETLGQRLAADISKTSAVDFRSPSATDQARDAIRLFREHQPAAATERLQQQGRVHEYQSPDHRLAAVALDYAAQPDRAVVVAPDAAERRDLTQLIRADLRSNGQLASDEHSVPVLVEKKLPDPRFAGNYQPGNEIHFRTGSPAFEGIPHNSVALVLEVDAGRNTLTIATVDGGQVTYDPAQLRSQTIQSKVYREESREVAKGERIRFTSSDKANRIRTGDFATVEQIDPDLAVRLDNGTAVKLDAEAAQHIDYGYIVESTGNLAVNRVILTGEAAQLAGLEGDLARLNPSIHELSVYTSDATQALQVELAQSPAAAELLSKPRPEMANFGVAEPSLAESIIEEIGLHL